MRRIHSGFFFGVMAASFGCSASGPADDAATGEGSGTSESGMDTGTDGGSDSDGGSDTGGELDCTCLEPDYSCGEALVQGETERCSLPAPCPILDGSAEAAECILELLIAGEPAQFYYRMPFDGPIWDGLCSERWSGTFRILGPGVGVDHECHSYVCDLDYGGYDSMHHYTFAEPAYYEACLGKSASVMSGCVVNGLTKGPKFPQCN